MTKIIVKLRVKMSTSIIYSKQFKHYVFDSSELSFYVIFCKLNAVFFVVVLSNFQTGLRKRVNNKHLYLVGNKHKVPF